MTNQVLDLKGLHLPKECLLEIFLHLEKKQLVLFRLINRWFASEIQKIVRKECLCHLDSLFEQKDQDIKLWNANVLSFYNSVMKGNWKSSFEPNVEDKQIHNLVQIFPSDPNDKNYLIVEKVFFDQGHLQIEILSDDVIDQKFEIFFIRKSKSGLIVDSIEELVVSSISLGYGRFNSKIWIYQNSLYILSFGVELIDDVYRDYTSMDKNLILEKFELTKTKFERTKIMCFQDVDEFPMFRNVITFRGPLLFFVSRVKSPENFLNIYAFDMILFQKAKPFETKLALPRKLEWIGNCLKISNGLGSTSILPQKPSPESNLYFSPISKKTNTN